jgi:hypothetical protein
MARLPELSELEERVRVYDGLRSFSPCARLCVLSGGSVYLFSKPGPRGSRYCHMDNPDTGHGWGGEMTTAEVASTWVSAVQRFDVYSGRIVPHRVGGLIDA